MSGHEHTVARRSAEPAQSAPVPAEETPASRAAPQTAGTEQPRGAAGGESTAASGAFGSSVNAGLHAPGAAPSGQRARIPVIWRGSLYASFAGFFQPLVQNGGVVREVSEYLVAHHLETRAFGRIVDRAEWERQIRLQASRTSRPTVFMQEMEPEVVTFVEERTHLHLAQFLRHEALEFASQTRGGATPPRPVPVPDHPVPGHINGPDTGVVGTRADFRMALVLGPDDAGDNPLEASRQLERGEYRWELFGAGGSRRVTAADAHRDQLARVGNSLSADVDRAAVEYDQASAEHAHGAQLVAASSLLLTPTTAAVRYGEYALTRLFEFVAGDVADQTIPFRDAGPFIIRCTAQPRALDRRPTRRPTVAVKTVTVREMGAEARRAFTEQDEQVGLVTAQRDHARVLGDTAEVTRLERQLAETRRRLQALPADAIAVEVERIDEQVRTNERELGTLRTSLAGARTADDQTRLRFRIDDLQALVDSLRHQLAEVRVQANLAGQRHTQLGAHTFRPRAMVIDETSGDRLDLLLEMSEPAQQGTAWHCQLSDVTTATGGIHHATAPDAEGALWAAVRRFAHANTYGRGRLFVQLPERAGARREMDFENAPGSTTLLRERLQDLGTVATAIASVIPGAGTVAMLAGAATSAMNIGSRMSNGTFRLDMETSIDLLTVLSAAATGATVIGRLRVLPARGGLISLVPMEEAGSAVRAIGIAGQAADHVQTIVTTVQMMSEYRRLQAAEESGEMTPTAARIARLRLLTQHVQAMHGMVHVGDGPHAAEEHPRAAEAEPRPAAAAEPAAQHAPAEPHPQAHAGPEPTTHAGGDDPHHRNAIVPPAPSPDGATPVDPAERARIRQARILVATTLTMHPDTHVVSDRTPDPLPAHTMRISAFEQHIAALGMMRQDPFGRRVIGTQERRGRHIEVTNGGGSFVAPGGNIHLDAQGRPHSWQQAFVLAHEGDHSNRERAAPDARTQPDVERFVHAYFLHEALAQANAFDMAARQFLAGGGDASQLPSWPEAGAGAYFGTWTRTFQEYWAANPDGNMRSASMRARRAAIQALAANFGTIQSSLPGNPTYDHLARQRHREAWEHTRPTQPDARATQPDAPPTLPDGAATRSTVPSAPRDTTPGFAGPQPLVMPAQQIRNLRDRIRAIEERPRPHTAEQTAEIADLHAQIDRAYVQRPTEQVADVQQRVFQMRAGETLAQYHARLLAMRSEVERAAQQTDQTLSLFDHYTARLHEVEQAAQNEARVDDLVRQAAALSARIEHPNVPPAIRTELLAQRSGIHDQLASRRRQRDDQMAHYQRTPTRPQILAPDVPVHTWHPDEHGEYADDARQLVNWRETFRGMRDRTADPALVEQWNNSVIEASRLLGEHGARAVVEGDPRFRVDGLAPALLTGGPTAISRSAEFDQVWVVGGPPTTTPEHFVLVEAKGNHYDLGFRRSVPDGTHDVQQGSSAYVDSILAAMRDRTLVDRIRAARARGGLTYIGVEVRIGQASVPASSAPPGWPVPPTAATVMVPHPEAPRFRIYPVDP